MTWRNIEESVKKAGLSKALEKRCLTLAYESYI
jgi:hypothetical protein